MCRHGRTHLVAHCNCRDCQHISDAGQATWAMYQLGSARMVDTTTAFILQSAAGNRVVREFRAVSGSPVHERNADVPGFVTISQGLLDDPNAFEPSVAMFARRRAVRDHDDAGVHARVAQPYRHPRTMPCLSPTRAEGLPWGASGG